MPDDQKVVGPTSNIVGDPKVKQQLRPRLLVVLSMHRSGSSVLTRALQVFGVELGDQLMSAAPGNNERGFFEDKDFVSLNEQLLARLDRSWADLRSIDQNVLTGPTFTEERQLATQLLASKLSGSSVFAFKDPRTAILLPFWRAVFGDADVDVSYLIGIRNPLSVARSLRARDGILLQKGVALWANYTLAALSNTRDEARVIVPFEAMSQNPGEVLSVIASSVGLPAVEVSDPAFIEFAESFFDNRLVHEAVGSGELSRSGVAPDWVSELFLELNAAWNVDPSCRGLDLENYERFAKQSRANFELIEALEGLLRSTISRAGEAESKLAASEVDRQGVYAAHDSAVAERDAALQAVESLQAESRSLVAAREEATQTSQAIEIELGRIAVERDRTIEALQEIRVQLDQTGAERDAAERRAGDLSARVENLERSLFQLHQQNDRTQKELCELSLIVQDIEDDLSRRLIQPNQNELDKAPPSGTSLTFSFATEDQSEVASHLVQQLSRVREIQKQYGDQVSQTLNTAFSSNRRLEMDRDYLASSIHATVSEIDEYRNSTSWKLTSPLRSLSRQLSKLNSSNRAPSPDKLTPLSSIVWKASSGRIAHGRNEEVEAITEPSIICDMRRSFAGGTPWVAVLLHAYYPDVCAEIISKLDTAWPHLQCYVTCPPERCGEVLDVLKESRHSFCLIATPNRGRDIAPFLYAHKLCILDQAPLILKLHTKKSPHISDGDTWREELLESLVTPQAFRTALHAFTVEPKLGVLAPNGHVLSTRDFMGANRPCVAEMCTRLRIDNCEIDASVFVAGSMFFARPTVFEPLTDLSLTAADFEVEAGQIDGTLAHAIERMPGVLTKRLGLRLAEAAAPFREPFVRTRRTYRFLAGQVDDQ